jgi:hypothetical protein
MEKLLKVSIIAQRISYQLQCLITCKCAGLFLASDPKGKVATSCKQAWYSVSPSLLHSSQWQAPSSPEIPCATVSVAQAATGFDGYKTTTVQFIKFVHLLPA